MTQIKQNKSGFRKYTRMLVATLMVVIFIYSGVAIYKKVNRGDSKAATNIPDEIPGWWYQKYFGSSVCEQDDCKLESDPDKDKLSNAQEFFYHSDPLDPFTVGDEMNDGELVASGFDPSRSGKMSFDQVISNDNILGESLVFNSDIRSLINESVDPNQVKIPEILDSEIKIVNDNSPQAIEKYLVVLNEVIKQNIPNTHPDYIEASIKSGRDISNLQSQIKKISVQMRNLEVPSEFAQIHKYTISLYQILPDVINPPESDILLDENNPIGNVWYDKAQIAFSLYQKISLESRRLEVSYKNAQ